MKRKILLITVIMTFCLVLFTGCQKDDNDSDDIDNIDPITPKFSVLYNSVDVLPGSEFSKENFGETVGYTELESCAFEGVDKVYTYEDVEITASPMNGVETIYSVYFLTENISTLEGVKLADEKSLMITKYGSNYENFGNEYKYTKGNVQLAFIVENDIITSIEYKYIIEE